uniref:Uncharacterized protein n=1 Tax=Anguilla anguilla TaxID=7936 RepID=A0A0E9X5Z3_ANGAN
MSSVRAKILQYFLSQTTTAFLTAFCPYVLIQTSASAATGLGRSLVPDQRKKRLLRNENWSTLQNKILPSGVML